MINPILLSPGIWAGAASLVSAIFTATGHGPAAAIISDPATAHSVSVLVTGIGAILAGFLPAPQK